MSERALGIPFKSLLTGSFTPLARCCVSRAANALCCAVQVHAYGAICCEGASQLYFATGTTALKLGYRKATLSAAEKKLAKAVGQDLVPGIASGVGAEEYRDILGGTGAHSSQPGMLCEMQRIFAEQGRRWVWQQDGARAHTLNSKTDNGKRARALILQHADDLLDDWPALAADLSPIENVWAIVEYHLWAEYEWSDLESFKRALRKAWADVTSDKALLRRVCGSFEKRRRVCIAAKGGKIEF